MSDGNPLMDLSMFTLDVSFSRKGKSKLTEKHCQILELSQRFATQPCKCVITEFGAQANKQGVHAISVQRISKPLLCNSFLMVCAPKDTPWSGLPMAKSQHKNKHKVCSRRFKLL
jgi:hypothetical protein